MTNILIQIDKYIMLQLKDMRINFYSQRKLETLGHYFFYSGVI